MKENAMQVQIAGWIKPTCEKMEEAIRIKNLLEAQEKFVSISEADLQAKLESERGWIRNLNSKLIDTGIATLIKNSGNGSEWLKEEIRRSDNRVAAAKSGLPLNKIVPK
jgi:hypothetical protein